MYTLYLYTEDPALREKYLTASCKEGDAGIDLYCPDDVPNASGVLFLNHRVRCRMTWVSAEGRENEVSYYLYPRSSLAKTGLRLANSVGIIDSGYRGEIIAAFDVRSDGYSLEKHQRLVQLCSPTLEKIKLVVIDQIERETDRGSGGFGSTGK